MNSNQRAKDNFHTISIQIQDELQGQGTSVSDSTIHAVRAKVDLMQFAKMHIAKAQCF